MTPLSPCKRRAISYCGDDDDDDDNDIFSSMHHAVMINRPRFTHLITKISTIKSRILTVKLISFAIAYVSNIFITVISACIIVQAYSVHAILMPSTFIHSDVTIHEGSSKVR